MTRFCFRRWLNSPVLIAGVAFALHIALLYHDAKSTEALAADRTPYGFELGNVAASMAAGNGLSSPLSTVKSGPTAWFTPLYPLLIAIIFKLCGIYSRASYIVIQFLNCVFASLTVFPIHAIAKRSFGGSVAVVAAWAWVFLPTALYFPILWLWDTSLIALAFALIFWVTLALPESRGVLPWAGYGALWAAGVLINPSIFSLFPFLLGWLAWRNRKVPAHGIKRVAITLLVFVIALLPWVLRNERVLGSPIIFRSNFGLEFWLGNNDKVVDIWTPELHPNENLEEGRKYQNMGEIAYMNEKEQEAFAFLRRHPGEAFHFSYQRFIYLWLGVDHPWDSLFDWYLASKLIVNVLISLLTLLGLFFAWRGRHPDAVPYILTVIIYPVIYYVTHSMLRYRFPIDPILIVLAAYGLVVAVLQIRKRRLRESETAASFSPLSAD